MLAFGICTVSTIICFIPIIVLAVPKLILPGRPFRILMSRWIMAIGEFWVAANAVIYGLTRSTRWNVSGIDRLSHKSWYLLLSNHQTWVDILALQTLFNRRIPFLKFFIKQELVWFPVLGIAWWAMDMPFMKRYSKSYLASHPEKKGVDLEITRKACKKFRDTPTTVINFIEGSRFSHEKKIKRASKFQHLLPPRAGGIALALSSMGEMFDSILDVTIVYPTGPPKFWEMCCGKFDEIIIEIRQRPVEPWMIGADYSNDREYRRQFHQWLTAIWEDKDRRITVLKKRVGDG